ncbi:hypothetical protein PAECIP111893_02360 [Paenibacillus plantiphilus]|uniref:Lipoprotein n=1 Tax=Paenibacillus plantiphilus TaxID=2905650 RepID=A0ABM9C6Q9_9BACL|nr:hypothetical protein [Paenibacillus plantiphilus]CAH1205499.1 hypothetical protein PAECIP111893_02360 [Paenibacillus plantiphilus]
MKKMKVSVVVLCCFMIVSACTNDNAALQAPSTSPNIDQTAPSATPSTGQSISSPKGNNKNETEVGDIAENKAEAEEMTGQPAFQLLEEALINTISTESVMFHTSVTNEITTSQSANEDEATELNQQYKYEFEGTMMREPDHTYIRTTINNLTYESKSDDPFYTNILDEYERTDDNYVLGDELLSHSNEGEDVWLKTTLGEAIQTIEYMEQLIAFFMRYPDQLSLSEHEGKTSIDLTLSKEQFANDVAILSSTIYNGTFEQEKYRNMLEISPQELQYQYVSILLDDTNHVSGYFVSYGMDDTEGMRVSNLMMVDFTAHNAAAPITIPEGLVENARVTEAYMD